MLSARTEEALAKTAAQWRDALAHSPEDPADVAYTAELGRARFDHRLAVAGEETADLAARLQDFLDGKRRGRLAAGRVKGGKRRKLAFLFTGQGAQAPGMGKVLYDHEPVFREAIDRCASSAAEVLDVPLLELLYGKASAQIQETRFAQPALFAVELALVELLRSRGIEPDAVLGHSVGEYVAATVAGVMRPEDGMALIAARGRAMQALPAGGAMAVLFEEEAKVMARLERRGHAVSIAAVNAPAAVVISGDGEMVAAIVQEAEESGVTTAPLVVSHAFHSPRMDPMLAAWERRAGAIRYAVPKIPLISNLDGQPYSKETPVDGAYWAKHVRGAVRFADGLETLIQSGITGFLEVGPHAVLTALADRARTKHPDLLLVSTLARGRDDRAALADARARLFAAGIEERPTTAPRQTVALPTYPFEERSCWLPLADREAQRTAAPPPKPESPALPGAGFVDTID
jgi:acyl transferase domain-containing protein